MYEEIVKLVDDVTPEMIAIRRDFHKHAEVGWTEMRTASLIARTLADLGYEVLIGKEVCDAESRANLPSEEELEEAYNRAIAQGADPEFVKATKGGFTSVVGILRCGEGPTVAVRFDIDALYITETENENHFPNKEGFASINKGQMHACGHDCHAASGLGLAKVLMQIKDRLKGTVKLVFQPAEEGGQGGKAITESGILDDVNFLFGAHNTDMGGNFEVLPGLLGSMAARKCDAVFKGKSAHAGIAPHLGNNALLAAATAVQSLHAIPRHGRGATRINVGKFVAGTTRNVIADHAYMGLDIRGETSELNEYMNKKVKTVLEASAMMYGCTVEYIQKGYLPSVISDFPFAERLGEICNKYLGYRVHKMVMNSGSEDISYMMDRVKSLGGQTTFMGFHSKFASNNHSPEFDLNEDYLQRSVKAFAVILCELMK
ncbi:MAG: amidohydrolase [Clostridia bacterium]|nr:amidohydrolase [Clostridia bacterium]